jgi:hypothetical protein
MLRKIGRLFVIKTRLEASVIIYALAIGAIERGSRYLTHLPAIKGVIWPPYSAQILFTACLGAVVLAGARIFDAIRAERRIEELEAELATLRASAL